MSRRWLDACADCGLPGVHGGYERCSRCYQREWAAGRMPRRTWPGPELAAEVAFLAEQGTPRELVAEKLGLQWASIVVAHRRHGVALPPRYRIPATRPMSSV